MSRRTIVMGILLWISAASQVSAHTLYMNNGRVIVGRIVAQSRTHVTIQTGGQTQVLDKQEIREISYSDPVIVVQPKKEEKKEVKQAVTPDTRWTILARSAVLPGWGHFQAGETSLGILYSASFAAALSYAGVKARAYQQAQDQYSQKTVLTFYLVYQNSEGNAALATLANLFSSNEYYKPFQTATREANAALIGLGGIFAIQLIHAYHTGTQVERKTAGGWEWGVAPDRKGISGGVRYVTRF